jgi:peptide/nickel transport system permease protein
MWGYILRRLLTGIVVLFIASFLMYVLVSFSGNPLANLEANPHIPKASIEAVRNELHLNQPLLERYWTWLTGFLTGNFGLSTTGQPVGPQLWARLLITLRLVIPATILAAILAIALGVLSAVRQYSVGDHISTAFAYLFFSMPVFVLAILLKSFFAIYINQLAGNTIFYTVGQNSPGVTGWASVGDIVAHTALPVITLTLVTYATWSRYQRSSLLEVLNSDYIRLARAKGLTRRRVLLVHALRNALIPMVTVFALDFAAILGGTVITETVFAWEGMGRFLYEGLTGPVSPDVNIVQAWMMIAGAVIVLFNLIADLAYGFLDPRIRYA